MGTTFSLVIDIIWYEKCFIGKKKDGNILNLDASK
jgi:hypothetical protein